MDAGLCPGAGWWCSPPQRLGEHPAPPQVPCLHQPPWGDVLWVMCSWSPGGSWDEPPSLDPPPLGGALHPPLPCLHLPVNWLLPILKKCRTWNTHSRQRRVTRLTTQGFAGATFVTEEKRKNNPTRCAATKKILSLSIKPPFPSLWMPHLLRSLWI